MNAPQREAALAAERARSGQTVSADSSAEGPRETPAEAGQPIDATIDAHLDSRVREVALSIYCEAVARIIATPGPNVGAAEIEVASLSYAVHWVATNG